MAEEMPYVEIKMGVTHCIGSDRYGGTIQFIDVDKRIIGVSDDEATVVEGSVHDGSAVYFHENTYKPGDYLSFWRWNKRTGRWDGVRPNVETGRWNKTGYVGSLSVGNRNTYRDPHI